MPARRTLATRVACVALALCASRVAADCAGPDSFGDLYEIDQHDAPPHLEDDALVVRVSGAGLDACAVPASDQFSLTWLKEADMAILKLRRDAPADCADANPAEGFVELRVPLPRELGRGADDFSRMLLGLPPGGPYEAYLLYDHSVLTGSADVWLDAEARAAADNAEAEAEAEAETTETTEATEATEATETESETNEAANEAGSVPRRAAAEKIAVA